MDRAGRISCWLLVCLLAAMVDPCWGQAIPTCQIPMCSSPGVVRLCAEALPENANLLLAQKSGAYCTCECPGILARTFSQVLQDRNTRDSADYERARYHMRSGARAGSARSAGNGPIARIDASGYVTWYSTDTCAYDRNVVDVVRRLFDLGLFKVSHSSAVTIESSDDIGPFPMVSYAENTSGGSGMVTSIQLAIPRRLLRDATVKEELLVFILLHEWGHAARNDDLEYSADEWATYVGMPKYYGWRWMLGRAMRDQVIAQLEDYYRSVIIAEDVPRASDTTLRDPDTYAELACRLNGIKGMYVAGQENPGMAFGYPADCWDDAVVGNHHLRSTPYAARRCDDGSTLSSFNGVLSLDPALKGAAEQILDAMESLEWLRDPCYHRPEFCGLTAQRILDRYRRDIPRYALRQQELLRVLSSAADMLRSLTQDLGRR